MGRWIYDDSQSEHYTIDDRTLMHLKLAIGTKFRRLESFLFTLHGPELPSGKGQRVFWMDPAVPIEFQFDSPESTLRLNLQWVDALVTAASSEGGLRIVPEPEPSARKT